MIRGLNDKESRTSFHHIANIGAKNVYRIFAGGNHSWVVIDDIIPIRRKFRAPSPVPDNKQMHIYGANEQTGAAFLRQSQSASHNPMLMSGGAGGGSGAVRPNTTSAPNHYRGASQTAGV